MKNYILFLLALSVGLSSCKKDTDKPRWKTDILAPLAKTSLSIKDILSDTSYIEGADSSISLIYRESLPSYTLDVLKPFDVPDFHRRVGLSSLQLQVDPITSITTLGQVAPQTKSLHGQTLLFFPDPPPFAGPSVPVNLSTFFESADFESGTMNVNILSMLPVTITSIRFQVINQNTSAIIIDTTITNIQKNAPRNMAFNLSGKTIPGNLSINLPSIDMAGGTNIKIDTNDAVTTTISFKDLKVKSARAIFPAQEIIHDTVDVDLANTGDIKAKKAILKSGNVSIVAFSTIQDSIYFTYLLPGILDKNGIPFKAEEVIPPSPDGSVITKTYPFDFSGYTLDMTGKSGNRVNAFYSDFSGRIENTGKIVDLSLKDSVDITVSFTNVVPSYLKGYLGDTTIIASGNIPLTIFDNIKAGALNFNQVKVSLAIENGIGQAGTVTVNSIKAANSKGDTVTLNDNNIVGVSKPVAKAVELSKSFQPVTTKITTDQAAPLINILPNSLSYNVSLNAGAAPTGTTADFENFIFDNSFLKPSFDIEVPLNLSAQGLKLSDTVDFLSEPLETSLNNGSLLVLAKNEFPLEGSLIMYFLNDQNIILDSLSSPEKIQAADINPLTNKVTQKKLSKIPFFFDEKRLHNILNSRRVMFKASFNTTGTNKVMIYSNYEIDFTIVADVNLSIK